MPPVRGIRLKAMSLARNDQLRIIQTSQSNTNGRAIVIYSADQAAALWTEAPLCPLGRLEVLGSTAPEPLDSRALKVGPRHGRRSRSATTHRAGTQVRELRFAGNLKLDVTAKTAR